MLTVITWNQNSKKLHQCSREKSKIVREVINKKVIPIFARYEVSLPESCPFHPNRDYYWWPQGGPNDDTRSTWTCPVCGVNFLCSQHFVQHWEREHNHGHVQQYRDDLVCLADYCDIFRCDVLIHKHIQRTGPHNFMGYLTFGHEDNLTCEGNKMASLEESCRKVVRQCAINLETNLSAQQFALVENELRNSLCGYLTCERYNEDVFTEEIVSRKVPITLFAVLGFIMTSGFCICYYLIWPLIQNGVIQLVEKTKLEVQADDNTGESQNKSTVGEVDKINKTTQQIINDHRISNKPNSCNFFQNIFEFTQEAKQDTFEYNEFNSNVIDFERKLRSIIEEEEEEKDNSEAQFSYNSYPIVSRKFNKRNNKEIIKPDVTTLKYGKRILNSMKSLPQQHSSNSFTVRDSTQLGRNKALKRRQSQEDYFEQEQEFDQQTFPTNNFVKPGKHSYSDRYPCYSRPSEEMLVALSHKSRSYSQSHFPLHNLSTQSANQPAQISSQIHSQNYGQILTRPPPRRQNSIEEEWDQKSQNSHSSMSIKSSVSLNKFTDLNDKLLASSQSSMSYNPTLSHPGKSSHTYHHFVSSSSKSNSNTSIASRTSANSRVTSNSSQQGYFKR